MSKKPFRSQASSSRAVSGAFGGASDGSAFGSNVSASTFGAVASSPLSYVYEPPDLSGFSEPSVGVACKNLQKKDGTTKSKALEELQNYISSLEADKGGLEDAVLEAWIKLYPRTSIDSSRRVRQLAHTLHGQIAASCGKRMAKHMPTVVASWLAGLYDNDKSVSRAANDSFHTIFNSEEKRKNVWRLYQSAILTYAHDVIVKETTNTLSDERTVSPDDAYAKYSRVVGAVIMMVKKLLEDTSSTDLEKSQVLIDKFLNEEKIWKLATHSDPFIRRALYRLLIVALAKNKSALNPAMISAQLLTSGLHTSQLGSAFDYIKAIENLTEELPDVWTAHYAGSGKKSAQNRLCHFLKKGSQSGPRDFWFHLLALLKNLPTTILVDVPASTKGSDDDPRSYSSILSALHEGLNNKDEARANQASAWNTYLEVSELVQSSLSEAADKYHFYKVLVLPILTQYVRPSPEQSRWTVAGTQQRKVCVGACLQALRRAPQAFEDEWHSISAKIIEDIKTSLPEQSKEYIKSQDNIAAETDRWYCLQASLLEDRTSESVHSILQKITPPELISALSILKIRNGKPYGAVNALNHAICQVPDVVFGDPTTKAALIDFMNNTVPDILLSPSAKSLVSLIDLLENRINISLGYKKSMHALMNAPESTAKSMALQSFIASTHLATTPSLFSVVIESLSQAIEDNDEANWSLVMAAISNPVVPKDLTDDILAHLIEGLSIDLHSLTSLRGLELAVGQNEGTVRDFALSLRGSTLLTKLLLLSDSPDEKLSRGARNLSNLLERALAVDGGNDQATKSMIDVVRRGFTSASADSLSVDALVSQAQKLLKNASSTNMPATADQLLPDLEQWNAALHQFVTRPPNASLAITNSFGGALCLISRDSSTITQDVSRDGDGYSSAFRMAQYTTKLINSTSIFDSSAIQQQMLVCKNMAIFIQLAGDDLSVPGAIPLWEFADPDLEFEVTDFIADAQALLASWLHTFPLSTFVSEAETQLSHESSGISSASYYSARAYSAMAIEITEFHGVRGIEDEETKRLKELRRSPRDVFAAAATFTSICESKELLRLCNGLLADLTGQDLRKGTDGDATLRQLVLLNGLLYRPENYVDEVPKQRLVFFVKHVVEQLQEAPVARPGIRAETMRALATVLPAISDIYGSFWEELLDLLPIFWTHASSDDDLYEIHSSLRLLSLLRRADIQQSNDDLLDAWAEKKGPIAKGLARLMVEVHDTPDDSHQPRRIVNELLGRQLFGLAKDVKVEVEDLYPVLASESTALQHAAYGLLHTQIPIDQEQVSLDKALSKDFVAQLPQELLSLILAPPTTNTLAEHNFERTMAPSLRSYLLSWQLTFDHWQDASYKVQGDYVAALKEGTYLQDFLSFALSILITARTRPIDASKFSIEIYTPNTEDSPERETHWLLIHLYYLSLRYLPTLSKEWWRDTASRQLNIALEAWSEKYISPLIIARELSTIATWGPSQATDDQPMTIKTSLSTREITASIPIDEQTMFISVRLPPSYPLARAEVKSIHRVGVVEKKWQSWLMISQGVMNLSPGSAGEGNALIDGLLAWRKNVSAAMKGQAECAICYSVVSGAKELPSKRCSTCKNSFHSSCLFRWFKSSNSSSCPLCRNAFHYS